MGKIRRKGKGNNLCSEPHSNILRIYDSIFTTRPSFSKQDVCEEAQSQVVVTLQNYPDSKYKNWDSNY